MSVSSFSIKVEWISNKVLNFDNPTTSLIRNRRFILQKDKIGFSGLQCL